MQIKFDIEKGPILEGPAFIVTPAGYGWVIEEKLAPEWSVVVQFSCRQDGKTHWAVVATEIDGDVAVDRGIDPTPAVDAAIEAAINAQLARIS
jgi:hypothetical protein